MLHTIKYNECLVDDAINDAICSNADENMLRVKIGYLRYGSNNARWKSITAMEKGYVRKGHGKILPYDGRYGKGVKVYHPNLTCRNRHGCISNRFYVVEYVVMY